jgi:hypothetical protein
MAAVSSMLSDIPMTFRHGQEKILCPRCERCGAVVSFSPATRSLKAFLPTKINKVVVIAA